MRGYVGDGAEVNARADAAIDAVCSHLDDELCGCGENLRAVVNELVLLKISLLTKACENPQREVAERDARR